jgi:hypothetical protein
VGRGPQVTSYRSLDARPGAGAIADGDSLLAIDHPEDRPPIQSTSSDGAAWSPLDISTLDPALADLPPNTYFYTVSGPLGDALLIARPPVDGGRQSQLLLFSPDLERWSFTDLDDVVADGTKVDDVLVGADRIGLLGHTDTGPEDGPLRFQTLTGTPPPEVTTGPQK